MLEAMEARVCPQRGLDAALYCLCLIVFLLCDWQRRAGQQEYNFSRKEKDFPWEICSVVSQGRALALTSIAPTWEMSFVRAPQEAGDELCLSTRPVCPGLKLTLLLSHIGTNVWTNSLRPLLCSSAKLWFIGSRGL